MQANRIRMGLIAAMLVLVLGQWSPAAELPRQPYVEGEVLVKYRENRAPQQALHYRSMWHMSSVRTFDKSGIHKVKLPSDMTVDQALALYRTDPHVLFAEPNYRYRLLALPDDPDLGNQWALHNVDAELAWDLGTGSTDIVVAVVDSGVDLNHPDLVANLWTNPAEIADNGLDDDGNGYVDDVHGWDFAANDNLPIDSHGHGTHVAGIIGAVGNNGLGLAGVCWQVSIMPLRFITSSDYGTTDHAIAAIEYADAMGADVINLSWGGPDYSQALKTAIDAVDALVVCAAGNSGNEPHKTPLYPASFNSANILSVGASDPDDYPAWFTYYSTDLVDVAAPGTNILSTIPDRQTLLADDFSTIDNWTFAGDGNAWGQQSLSGNKALTESPGLNVKYTDNMDTWARLGPLDLSGQTGTRLDFNIIGTADSGDKLLVEASSDGSPWSMLWIGLVDGPTKAITGTIGAQTSVADLKQYDDTANFYLRLRFISDASGAKDGYLIDDLTITAADTTHGGSAYAYYQGTSMATAYTSGTAALVMARQPSLSPTEVKLVIESTVDPKPQLTEYVATGGRINANNAMLFVATVAAVDLQAQAADVDRIDLDWTTEASPVAGFQIQRRPASGSDFATIATVGADAVSYADDGLDTDTTYIYRILSSDGSSLIGYSNEATATTLETVTVQSSAASDGGGGGGGCFIGASAGDILYRLQRLMNAGRFQ